MTEMPRANWTLLNAYVDGELDAAAAADVAAAIARDSETAAQVAALARLKAATQALSEIATPAPSLARPRRAALPRAIAAGLAALLIAAGAAWSILGRTQEPAWLRPAAAAHEQWLAAPASLARSGDVSPAGLLQEARAVGIPRVPDLADAGLRPAWVDAADDAALYVGYIGVHGCRLGLWVGRPVNGAPTDLVSLTLPRLTAYAWQVKGRAYVMVARGMDADRLGLLARTIERLTQQGDRLDDQARTALREAPLTGSACTA